MLSEHHPHAVSRAIIDECQPRHACRCRHERAIELDTRDAAAHAARVFDCDLVACAMVLEYEFEARPASGDAGREGESCAANPQSQDGLDAGAVEPSGRARIPGPATAS